MNLFRHSLLGLLVFTIAGCLARPLAPAVSAPPAGAPEATQLIFTLAPATEGEASALSITGDDGILARALLLTLRGTPEDEAEARRLLTTWLEMERETAAAPLAHRLDALLQERQRLRSALEAERRQRELLQQQLDELMSIEQQLNRRLPAVEVPPS